MGTGPGIAGFIKWTVYMDTNKQDSFEPYVVSVVLGISDTVYVALDCDIYEKYYVLHYNLSVSKLQWVPVCMSTSRP